MMIEEWKTIPWMALYEVSSLGNVRNSKNGRLKSTHITKEGRIQTSLYIDGKLSSHLVHRLVLTAFDGPCPEGLDCNHKDGNPQNNNVDNLEWRTRSDNLSHAYANDLHSQAGDKNGNAKLKEGEVWLIKKLLRAGFQQKFIAKMFRTPPVTINHISTGRSWAHVVYEVESL